MFSRRFRAAKVVHARAAQRPVRRLAEPVPPVVVEYRRRVPNQLSAARERIDCRLCRNDDSAAAADRALVGQGWPAAGRPGEFVIFVVASLGCLLASDVWAFLLFRTMQAAIVSGFALSRVIIRDTEPAQKAASLMGYLSIAWAIAPMLAPMLGGAFDQLFGWRANFWAFLGFGAAVLVLCWLDLGETNKNPSETFTKQFKAFPSCSDPAILGYSLCMAFSMGALYAFLAAAPLVATTVFQMSPATLGFYMGSTAAGFILGSFVSGRFAALYPLTTMMVAGRIVACAGLAAGLSLLLAGVVQ